MGTRPGASFVAVNADLYILPHAGHGSPEFYQDSVHEIMIDFFDKRLKAGDGK